MAINVESVSVKCRIEEIYRPSLDPIDKSKNHQLPNQATCTRFVSTKEILQAFVLHRSCKPIKDPRCPPTFSKSFMFAWCRPHARRPTGKRTDPPQVKGRGEKRDNKTWNWTIPSCLTWNLFDFPDFFWLPALNGKCKIIIYRPKAFYTTQMVFPRKWNEKQKIKDRKSNRAKRGQSSRVWRLTRWRDISLISSSGPIRRRETLAVSLSTSAACLAAKERKARKRLLGRMVVESGISLSSILDAIESPRRLFFFSRLAFTWSWLEPVKKAHKPSGSIACDPFALTPKNGRPQRPAVTIPKLWDRCG